MSEKDILDDFWNIERITPVKKPTPIPVPDTEPVSVHFGKDEKKGNEEWIPGRKPRLVQGEFIIEKMHGRGEQPMEYTPDNPDILRVRITKWPTDYAFYDRFLKDGKKYLHQTSSQIQYIPFYSYMPQYHQLSIYQLKYYLWWRENIRNSVFLQTDGGYIFLYLYELINIDDDEFPPAYRAERMARVWLAYRKSYPKLDTYIGEWLCDFCLIHKLPPPKCLQKISGQIAAIVSLREFYTSSSQGFNEESLCQFVRAHNTYNYRRSAAYAKNSDLFEKHLIRSVAYAIRKSPEVGANLGKARLSRMSRDSYSGALCASDIKMRIDIEYYSHFTGTRFKPMLNSLMRHSENRLRERVNIKSRLVFPKVSEELKEYVDEYYSNAMPYTPDLSPEADRMTADERIRYELYEPKSEKLDIDSAFAIEDKSWDTTLKLVPQDEIEYIEPTSTAEKTESEEYENDYESFIHSLSEIQYEFLKLIYNGNISDAKALCEKNNLLPFAVQDEINSICSDTTGDIIMQDMEIIGDYRDELKFK